MLYTIQQPEFIKSTASQILDDHPFARVFLLQGAMGAGKTTLIRSFCEILEVIDNVSSPTFSIINEYQMSNGHPLYHFDLYRLKNREELLATGAIDYIDSGNYCFVEWPEIAASFFPPEAVVLQISVEDSGNRILKVTPNAT